MKINPIGIQSYQQLTHRENFKSERTSEQNRSQSVTDMLTITPQAEGTSSKIAVKANAGNYAEMLTVEEKRALELLFEKFRESGRFGQSYLEDMPSSSNTLGKVIDVKV